MFNKKSRLVWFAFMCGVVSSAALFADFTHNPAIARYVYIAQAVMSGPSITPDTPTPSSDKCENCDGRGKLGDGRVATICPVCDGTGKTTTNAASAGWPPRSTLVIENPDCDCESCDCKNCDCGSCKPIETPRRHNEIDVHTMENCKGCKDWKSTYWAPTKRVGWGLEECGLLPEHTVAPSFTVTMERPGSSQVARRVQRSINYSASHRGSSGLIQAHNRSKPTWKDGRTTSTRPACRIPR